MAITKLPSVTAGLLDVMLGQALSKLVGELGTCDWYIREHEVVNLFVFAHLVPAFQANGLDLTQIAMESGVAKVGNTPKSKLGGRKDLVIWREPRSTLWKGCNVARPLDVSHLREHACRPLAVLEWTHISRVTSRPSEVWPDHRKDIAWLTQNVRGRMFEVGYAILVDQSRAPTLTCRRIDAQGETDFLSLPKAVVATAGA